MDVYDLRGSPSNRVYPRACGGTFRTVEMRVGRQGLSPRVRGNLSSCEYRVSIFRSIPARAGEPATGRTSIGAPWVYPRACGGTLLESLTPVIKAGLSPRVRGNHRITTAAQAFHRSIPARAGEPATAGSPATPPSVYPRACGGTSEAYRASLVGAGLSPRVRGNLPFLASSQGPVRSIPARAGEPTM